LIFFLSASGGFAIMSAVAGFYWIFLQHARFAWPGNQCHPVKARIQLLLDKWPFSAAPEPASSSYHNRTFWAHVLHDGKTWNLIIQLDPDATGKSECLAHVHFRHPDAPHNLLRAGNVLDLCVGNTVYAKATIEAPDGNQ
jgi:hypothetical protein